MELERSGSRGARWALGIAALLLSAAANAGLEIAVSRSTLSAPFFVAETKGYFRAAGVEVRIEECIGGQRCLQQILDGKAQLATASSLPIMFQSFKHSDFRVVANFVISPQDMKLVGRSGKGTAAVSDLRHKRVAIVPGSASEYFLHLQLIGAGVPERDVTKVAVQADRMQSALLRGEVDAASVWEPFASLALQSRDGRLTRIREIVSYTVTFNLITHRSMTGTRDADLVRILRALDRAVEFMLTDSAAAQSIVRQRLALDDATLLAIWPDLRFGLSLDQSLVRTLEGEARWARRSKVVPDGPAPNYLNLMYAGPLLSVKPAAVTIAR